MLSALIVDDDVDFLSGLTEILASEGFDVMVAHSLDEARRRLTQRAPDVVLLDLVLPDGDSVDLLREIKSSLPSDVVLVSGVATVDSAIEALRLGALDYLTKPVDQGRLRTMLAHIARLRDLKSSVGTLRGQLRKFGRFANIVGVSPAMQEVYDLIAKVAPTDATVFITGESGTGKELVAQTICELSTRQRRPVLPLDFGSIPQTLIESELFGHERGSFTGATQLRKGCFERATGGTLFLDEITEMPIELQVKLLRVLESGTLTRVGGDEPIPVNVRLIAASNRVPAEAIKAGKLREDLYYRLNVFPIVLPPLRKRDTDALLLAEQFLESFNIRDGAAKRLSAAGRDRIMAHPWPGNVRELKNELQRAFIMEGDTLELIGLRMTPVAGAWTEPPGGSLENAERVLILRTLEDCGGDKKRAARLLGISLKTLYNRLHVYAGD